MNWINFDRLVQHLNDLQAIAPHRFHYFEPLGTGDNGCVDCHCRFLGGYDWDVFSRWSGGEAIQRFLECSKEEAFALWHPDPVEMFSDGDVPHGSRREGVDGIREALRRLSVLATRYERPSAFVPNESAFLAQLKADLSDRAPHQTTETV